MAPPAAYAVFGQCESSVCEECCGEVTCKRGGHLHAVLVVLQGRTLGAAGRAALVIGAARLSLPGPSRTRLSSPVAGRAHCQAEMAAPLCL